MVQKQSITKETIYKYFNKIEAINQQFERDVVASKRFVYVGQDEGYKVYEELDTGHTLRILSLEPYYVAV
jgi:hypothetical protein